MLLQPGIMLTVVLNILFWAVVSFGIAWLGSRFSRDRIKPAHPVFRRREWEQNGAIYEKTLQVRRWKDHLPDWGGIFAGGFSKGRLRSVDDGYLRRFVIESCRGEAVHWAVMFLGPLSLIWNPWWGGTIMTAYGIAANLPCIIVQRYNRIRLQRLLEVRKKL